MLEFVLLAVVVLVPLMYVVLAAVELQRSAFAVTQAAREAGRAWATADDVDTGTARARYAVELALADQGLDPAGATLSAVPVGADCPAAAAGAGADTGAATLEPGASFRVCVVRTFRLPGVPGHLDSGLNTVTGSYLVRVEDLRGDPAGR